MFCGNVIGWTLALSAMAGAAGAAETPAAAKPKTRVHNAEFVMPDGWVRGSNEYGNLMLMPPGLKTNERCEIHICPFDQTSKTLEQHAQADVEQMATDFNNVKVVEAVKSSKLTSGVKTATVVMTADEKLAGRPPIRVMYTECDGGHEGKDGYQAIAFVTSSPELWSKYWPQYEELLKTVSFPSHTRLAEPKEGGIPLTMYTVNTCIDFCEWFMDVPYTDDQRAAMKQYMVDLWKGDDAKSKEEREGMQEVIKGSIEVAKLYEPQKKELARVAIRQEAIKQWREDGAKGDKMASFMIDIYDAANKPIAQGKPGEPALTRQSADATMELLHFMGSHVAGYSVSASTAQKDEFAKRLAAAYGETPVELKKEIQQMPLYWAAMRVQWPELPLGERKKLTEAWATSDAVKPIVEEIKKAKEKAAAEAKANPSAQLAAMQKLYQQQQNVAMISNMMAMQHRTRMTIINNIGSSNYRYEYKYVYRNR